jgi:NAD(P)H dehydrogenase (quinone)
MKVHLVHAHSESDSFVSAMRDTVFASFEARGDRVTVSDLYAMKFNPISGPEDFGARSDPAHLTYALEQRHGFKTRTLAPDILAEIDKILDADIVGFTFPLYWFGLPAILKGWVDRVFISGTFYGGKRVYGKGGMAGKRAFAAFSLGGREYMFGPEGIHGELVMGMMRGFFQGTLGYVGFDVHHPWVGYHVPYLPLEQRQQGLQGLSDYVTRLDEQPVFPMPNVDDFGPSFEPRSRKY